jgi:hypothetical protein
VLSLRFLAARATPYPHLTSGSGSRCFCLLTEKNAVACPVADVYLRGGPLHFPELLV